MNDRRLQEAKNFLFDLDGCIWFGDEPAPGAAPLVAALRAAGQSVFFLTNVSAADSIGLSARLLRMGIEAEPSTIVAPLSVLVRHPLFAERTKALVVGREVVRQVLNQAGVEIVTDPREALVVVLGSNPHLTFAELTLATQALDGGAALLALNLDHRVPTRAGQFVPGVGALAALLTTATGVQPELIGKPSPFYFRQALEQFAISSMETVMVGDSIDSDVAGGQRVGLLTVLVGDGLGRDKADVVPDYCVSDLAALQELLALSVT